MTERRPEYPPEYDIYPPEGFTLTVVGVAS